MKTKMFLVLAIVVLAAAGATTAIMSSGPTTLKRYITLFYIDKRTNKNNTNPATYSKAVTTVKITIEYSSEHHSDRVSS